MSITAIAVLAFVVVAVGLVSAAVIWFAREDAVRYRRTHRSDPRGRFRASYGREPAHRFPRIVPRRSRRAKRQSPLAEVTARTLYAARGRPIPLRVNSPTGSTVTASPTAMNTRGLIRI